MDGSSEAPHDIENPCIPLATSMNKELDDLPPLSNSCCIYRVPEELRSVREKAYTPQIVSIGPLHHGKEGLKDMEDHKKRYLRYFLRRTNVGLEDYVKTIKGKERELRSCYAHDIELCGDKFVRMILVDAAFIIEFLLRGRGPITQDSNDRIFSKPWLSKFIEPDLLLLENQLPFFILEDLFATAGVPGPSVFHLFCIYFRNPMNLYVHIDDLESSSRFKVEHFVDLIRTLRLPTKEERSKNRGPIKALDIPTMMNLYQAGVKFKAIPSNNQFGICFKDGILKIPKLIIDDHTESLLRNIIAFEQCHCYYNYFSDYITLLDYLVNTTNDVELLVKNKIVENLLGDNTAVSNLINSLCKGVTVNTGEFYYATLTEDLNRYYNKKWNKWKADLKQKYLKSPWTIISVIAGTLIIILTIIQTVCSFSQCSLS